MMEIQANGLLIQEELLQLVQTFWGTVSSLYWYAGLSRSKDGQGQGGARGNEGRLRALTSHHQGGGDAML